MAPEQKPSGSGALAKAVQHPWFVAGPLALVVAVASTLIAAHLDVWIFGDDGPPPSPPSSAAPVEAPPALAVQAEVNDPVAAVACPPYAAAPDGTQVDTPEPDESNTAWAARVSARPMGQVQINLLLQGSTAKAIVITGLSAVVDEHLTPPAAPVSRYSLGNGCGDDVPPRNFFVDLDAPQPEVVPEPPSDDRQPTPSFPYTVTDADVELFTVKAGIAAQSVAFHLEVAYLVDGEPGTAVVEAADGSDFEIYAEVPVEHDYFLNRATGEWRDFG